MGSLAGAGTLGFLIPPSIIMIIYGVLAEASILKLFIAGILPGIVLAGSYMVYIAIRSSLSDKNEPKDDISASWGERIVALKNLGPVLFLIIMVIGSMYGGYASPSRGCRARLFGGCDRQYLSGLLHAREHRRRGIRRRCGRFP